MNLPDFYPASPPRVPAGLTEPSASFRRHINLMAFALLVFFVLYFSLMALLAVGIACCFLSRHVALWVLGVMLLIPFGLLIKNLFSRQPVEKGYELEIDLRDHPRLDRFIQCLCFETGAPMPDRVLLNFEVNASAGTNISLFSLFLAPTRTLTLGLGLLNVLNITEFKALLAHEFGHLSQSNMKSAPYIRLAMQVMLNIVQGTRFIGLNRVMEWVFFFVVKLRQALSREMEFHADLVAVSVTGSDAVPNAMFKSYWAEACMEQIVVDLETARDHGLYSLDIFLHQTQVVRFLRKRHKNPFLGEPPMLLPDRAHTFQIFQPDPEEDEIAKMWANHPPNHEREINAKAEYIRTEFREESAWCLFEDPQVLREKVSRQFYRQVFRIRKKETPWSSGAKVQQFLDEEYAETVFDVERYGFLYNHRNLETLDLRALRETVQARPNSPEELLASHRTMYTSEVKKFAEVFQRHIEEVELLQAIKEKWYVPRKKKFDMRGRKMHIREASQLIEGVEREIKADVGWLYEFDRRVFVTYFELALVLKREWAEELYERYRFHYVMQGMWKIFQPHKPAMNYMFDLLNQLQTSMLDDDLFHLLIEVFRQAFQAAKEVLDESRDIVFPDLANMPAGKPIRQFLLEGQLSDKPSHFDQHISVKWLVKFANQFHDIEKRLSRLHFKSLGNILALQEAIGERAEKTWPILFSEVLE